MPIVRISGNPDISTEDKREMVKEVSKIVAKSYNLPIEAISIIIDEIPPENVGVGGDLLIDRQ